MSFTILKATPEMAQRISALIHLSFSTLAAADWEAGARERFLGDTSADGISKALVDPAFAAVGMEAGRLAGFILMRKPTVVAMLFVHPDELRKGIARRLWEAARGHLEVAYPRVTTVELNATPYALPAYKALGFVPISAQFIRGGSRATRMACWLPARKLGADSI